MRQAFTICLLAMATITLVTTSASAQSAIAGVVKDASGGVLPGVTVEASSPALIEKVRTAVTDNSGQYQIIDLRPGTYSVVFSLPGFNTARREGIDLPAAFTATVNIDLRVGAVEETITVTGEAPLVDIRSTVAQSVLTREDLDAIPTGRDVFAIGQVLPGVTTSRPDVGGSEGMQQITLQVHGSSQRDMVYHQDGMSINNNFGSGNQTGYYYNDSSMEEVSFQTSALPAEVSVGGVRINMIPKIGGNTFSGSMFLSGSSSSWASSNQTDELFARGLTLPNRLDSVYDFNVSLGGPIKRDRLWFFTSFRRWAFNWFVANTVATDGSQATDDNRLTDATARVTYLANQRNRITVGYQRGWKYRGARRTNQPATFVSPEAAMLQTTPMDYILQTKWTSTLTNSLLFETGLSVLKGTFITGYRPDTAPTAVTKFDFTNSLLYNAPIQHGNSEPNPLATMASVSYTTGRHNLKAGVQVRWGPNISGARKNGDILLRFNNGVADSVDLFNTPVEANNHLDADHGVYLQDSWTHNRLTVNGGIRWDYFKLSIPAQSAPAGTWVEARSYPEIPVVSWNNVVPRVGVVYDVFGDGRTALKASASQYVQSEGVGLAQDANPLFVQSQRCAWNDANRDTEAQANEISGCTGFTGGINTRLDPEIRRPYNWEYVAQIEHQVLPRVSAGFAYHHRRASDLYGTRNVAVPPSAYSPVSIVNPLSGDPLTVYNQTSGVGLVDRVLANQDELSVRYHGIELTTQMRLSRGMVRAGFTAGRNRGSTLGSGSDLNNPNVLVNHIGAVGFDATYLVNLAASWRFPLDINVSGTVRTGTGQPLNRTFNVTRSIVPGLGQVSQTVNLAPRGGFRLQNNQLLDLRLAKGFTFRGVRLEGLIDVYNVLNSSATVGEVQVVGPSLGRVSEVLPGRMLRLGLQMKF